MKKYFLTALLALSCGLLHGAAADVGFWFDCPQSITGENVSGVRFGLPVAAGNGTVSGLELSLLLSATRNVEGLQASLLGTNVSDFMNGAQIGFFNLVSADLKGSQWGLFNHSQKRGWQFGLVNCCTDNAKFQLGLLNYNAGGWLPVTILVNFGGDAPAEN